MTPIGSIIYWPSQLIPTGYLLCDGREVAINDYPELYAAIGNIGGDDVDAGYFRLPDMRGVVAGGYHSGLSSSSPLYGNFGDQVGNPTHTHTQGATGSTALTIAQMPAHTHAFTYNQNNTLGTLSYAHATGGYGNQTTDEALGFQNIRDTGGGKGHTHTNPTTNSSSSVQPTKLYNWVIKAKHVTQLGGTVSDDFKIEGKLIMSSEGIFLPKQDDTSGSDLYTDYDCLRGFKGNLYYDDNLLQYADFIHVFDDNQLFINIDTQWTNIKIPFSNYNASGSAFTFDSTNKRVVCNKDGYVDVWGQLNWYTNVSPSGDYQITIAVNDSPKRDLCYKSGVPSYISYDFMSGRASKIPVKAGDYIDLRIMTGNTGTVRTFNGEESSFILTYRRA